MKPKRAAAKGKSKAAKKPAKAKAAKKPARKAATPRAARPKKAASPAASRPRSASMDTHKPVEPLPAPQASKRSFFSFLGFGKKPDKKAKRAVKISDLVK